MNVRAIPRSQYPESQHSALESQYSSELPNLPRIEDIQHGVGKASGQEQDTIDDHRKSAERAMPLATIGPNTLNTHFDANTMRPLE